MNPRGPAKCWFSRVRAQMGRDPLNGVAVTHGWTRKSQAEEAGRLRRERSTAHRERGDASLPAPTFIKTSCGTSVGIRQATAEAAVPQIHQPTVGAAVLLPETPMARGPRPRQLRRGPLLFSPLTRSRPVLSPAAAPDFTLHETGRAALTKRPPAPLFFQTYGHSQGGGRDARAPEICGRDARAPSATIIWLRDGQVILTRRKIHEQTGMENN